MPAQVTRVGRAVRGPFRVCGGAGSSRGAGDATGRTSAVGQVAARGISSVTRGGPAPPVQGTVDAVSEAREGPGATLVSPATVTGAVSVRAPRRLPIVMRPKARWLSVKDGGVAPVKGAGSTPAARTSGPTLAGTAS